MGGLVWPKQGSKGASVDDALTLKKTVIRYVLLSWTMCLGKISSRLKKKMKNVEDYIDKGLLTRTEASLLKENFDDKRALLTYLPQVEDSTSDGWTVQWCVPLSWAILLINNAFNNTGLVPKDHKDLIGPICKFRNDLHLLHEYYTRPLPAVYKQVFAILLLMYS